MCEEPRHPVPTLGPFEGIELLISPLIAPKGKPTWRHGPGLRMALHFHDFAEREVWLDSMRMQGLQG